MRHRMESDGPEEKRGGTKEGLRRLPQRNRRTTHFQRGDVPLAAEWPREHNPTYQHNQSRE